MNAGEGNTGEGETRQRGRGEIQSRTAGSTESSSQLRIGDLPLSPQS